MPRGEANYYDVLGADAFGNFRQLLQDVTLNPMMGQLLNMLGNDKGNATTDPDENYAREVMQLFTIGLYQLNNDGSQKLDGNGQSHSDLLEHRRDGTGRGLHGLQLANTGRHDGSGVVELLPVCRHGIRRRAAARWRAIPSHHSTVEKDFLGVTIPASTNRGSGWRSEDCARHAIQSSEPAAVLLQAVD